MKSNYLYLLFICIISCLFVSCSDEDNKGEEIPEWNRFRTTNVLVYAHLSEQNLFSSCSYKEVGVIYQKHCSCSGIVGQDERCLWANCNHKYGYGDC